MNLTPGRQRKLFAAIAIVLVVVGFLLVKSQHSDSRAGAVASPRASLPTASPAASGVPPTAAIYRWVPFTPLDLTKAVNTVTAFAKAYQTWSYTESESAYGATLKGLVTPRELTLLEGYQYGTAATAQMTADRMASTGSGTVKAILSWGSCPSPWITFSVIMNATVTSTSPAQSRTGTYTVAVESTAAGWEVDSVELSGLRSEPPNAQPTCKAIR